MIGHASSDERGKLKGGQAGDQTGKEVYIRTWYNRPWTVVLRPKNVAVAEKIAVAMERACANANFGYDQNQRNTAWNVLKNWGFDPSKLNTPAETDCSALTCICCAYAGVPVKYLYVANNSSTTATLRQRLKNSGMFTVLTNKKYLTSDKYLQRGDILLYEGHHVAVNLTNGSGVVAPTPTPAPTPANGYVYNGVDYSAVFNPTFYANKYADLRNAGLTTNVQLFNHFITNGMMERRQGCADFDVVIYMQNYSDLRSAFGTNYVAYYTHYCTNGKKENRVANRMI